MMLNNPNLVISNTKNEALLDIADALDVSDQKKAKQGLLNFKLDWIDRDNQLILNSLWKRTLNAAETEARLSQETIIHERIFRATLEKDSQPEQLVFVLEKYGDQLKTGYGPELVAQCFAPFLDLLAADVLLDLINIVIESRVPEHVFFYLPHLVRKNKDWAPTFQDFQELFLKLAGAPDQRIGKLAAMLGRRNELKQLIRVYGLLNSGGSFSEAMKLSEGISNLNKKLLLTSYLLETKIPQKNLKSAIRWIKSLAKEVNPKLQSELFTVMSLKEAVIAEDWTKVLSLASKMRNGPLKNNVECYIALTEMKLGYHSDAEIRTGRMARSDKIDFCQKNMAVQIGALNRLATDGINPITIPANETMPISVGRPLVQSLWDSGPLRWIDELSMRSFVENGWRYHLYAYEIPKNVPDGVEVLDATRILPRSLVTKGTFSRDEFSHLFRYALLKIKGGMWADTNIINLCAFDPDGHRFLASKNDNFKSLCAALLAAPPDDVLINLAFKRAMMCDTTNRKRTEHLGSKLLAELFRDFGASGYQVYNSNFVSYIDPRDTSFLSKSLTSVGREFIKLNVTNLRLQTEIYELAGLTLGAKPPSNGFLSELYKGLVLNEVKALKKLQSFKEKLHVR